MPIPPFNGNLVLPSHKGRPTNPSEMSPYPINTVELCQHFSTSKERVDILRGFMTMRDLMSQNGITEGFQWLNGSFMQAIEQSESRPPKDMDAVTFFASANPDLASNLQASFPAFFDSREMKRLHKVDHYAVDLNLHPAKLVEFTRYWFGLFSHTRSDVWKGMLRVELNTPYEDSQANGILSAWVPALGEES